MFTSLRARLWLSYAILIIMILAILAVGVFIYIIRNPLIDRQALARLDAAQTLIQRQMNDRATLALDRGQVLQRIGNTLEIRLLLFSSTGNLILDSQPDSAEINWPENQDKPARKGRISDQEGGSWLYSSWPKDDGEILVLTLPRQGGLRLLRSPFLRETLREDFLPSFARAGLLAFLVAVVLAVWMGNWIASPLKEM
ncbi:MAG: hypothetical protein P8Y37_01640 [Anaerolineales bacterium]